MLPQEWVLSQSKQVSDFRLIVLMHLPVIVYEQFQEGVEIDCDICSFSKISCDDSNPVTSFISSEGAIDWMTGAFTGSWSLNRVVMSDHLFCKPSVNKITHGASGPRFT